MAKWKPVIIDRDGDFEGLMAIEELENYEDSKVIHGGKLLKVSIHVVLCLPYFFFPIHSSIINFYVHFIF